MEFSKTNIEGVYLITPKVFKDQRGYLFESFSKRELEAAIGYGVEFLQEHEFEESQGFSAEFNAEAYRMISCTIGSIEVKITDERTTVVLTQPLKFRIDDLNHLSVFVPKGCKINFRIMSDVAKVSIKHSEE